MIRKFVQDDIDVLMDLWLAGNLQAHSFIPERYWKDHLDPVREMLPLAELYVYVEEAEGRVDGFVGLNGEHIEGIFVRKVSQFTGVGTALLEFVKERRERLTLGVYRKNQRAVRFYERKGFRIREERTDPDTGESEYEMIWEKEEGALQ